ncbi:MAG: hypothetical protein LIQ30_13525 [Planctomycetes bacterium]|nr:hypothetical protein [Planctomycetota bacterium]
MRPHVPERLVTIRRRFGRGVVFASFLSLLLGILLLGGGCMPEGGSSSRPLETAEYSSEHYDVRVVGQTLGAKGDELARHGARMMEKVFDAYAALDEVPRPPGESMPFNFHLNRTEYDRQAARYDFPAHTTNGFCTTGGEVHVYFQKSGKIPPEATAMHEGFHQYCYRAVHYPTPQEVFEQVPGYKVAKLPTVPLWLAEGMAMNMESATIRKDHDGIAIAIDDVGSVNVPRLTHLVQLMRSGRMPSVRSTLNLIMGDQISTDDYSVMWGIVFDLRMATRNAIYIREQKELERAGPGAVRQAIDAAIDPDRPYPYMRWPVPVAGRLMRACRVAWGVDVPATIDKCARGCARGAREPRDFDRQWNRRLTQAALAEVERLLHDNGESLEEWEEGWKKRMLALYTEVRGGQYQYVEPKGVRYAERNFLDESTRGVRGGGSASPGGRTGRRAIGDW